MQHEERREKEFRSQAKPLAAIVENHLWVEADRPDCECKPAQDLIHHVPSLCVPSRSVSHLFFVGFMILNLIHFLLHQSLSSWTAKVPTSQPDSNRNLSADPLRELSSEERGLQTSLSTTKDNKTVTTLSSPPRPHSLNPPTPSRHFFLRIRHTCVIPPPSLSPFLSLLLLPSSAFSSSLTALSKSVSPSNPKQLGGRLLIFPFYILELLSESVSVWWQYHHLKDHCATLNPQNPKPLFRQSCRIEQRICCASQYSNKELSVVQNYANSVESSISCMMPERSSFKMQELAT